MSRDFYLVCRDCQCKTPLGSLGILTAHVGGEQEDNSRILDFIHKHEDCRGNGDGYDEGWGHGVMAVDEHRMNAFGWDNYRVDGDEPTRREAEAILRMAQGETTIAPDPAEVAAAVVGLRMPNLEERRAIMGAAKTTTIDEGTDLEAIQGLLARGLSQEQAQDFLRACAEIPTDSKCLWRIVVGDTEVHLQKTEDFVTFTTVLVARRFSDTPAFKPD